MRVRREYGRRPHPQSGTRRASPGAREALRPTAGRVRDALFNILGAATVGSHVLDLFAGTGALGIEALHRGAEHAVFVEHDPRRARAIEERLRQAGVRGRAEVRSEDALVAVGRLAARGASFDLIFLDPPYGAGWLTRSIAAVAGAGLLESSGVIVGEGHWRDRPSFPGGYVVTREARYGETALWFIRAGPHP
ncbi:MAG: 16S rRNA (guanine(966)-N(2))-methyltransferase RsmD [bacterium]